MDAKLETVVKQILKGTTEKKFEWETTERRTEYRLKMEQGVVSVDKWTGVDDETGEQHFLIDISFHNAAGEVVERTVYDRDSDFEDYTILVPLYEAARRSSLKVEETLGKIFKEIENKSK